MDVVSSILLGSYSLLEVDKCFIRVCRKDESSGKISSLNAVLKSEYHFVHVPAARCAVQEVQLQQLRSWANVTQFTAATVAG